MREILVIRKNNIEKIEIEKLDESVVGQKTLGLVTIPVLWTPDFFVVSSDYINEFRVSKKPNLIVSEFSKLIIEKIDEMNLGGKIILRSSASEESMNERGKYDSQMTTISNLEKDLKLLSDRLVQTSNENDNIAIIVQKYIDTDKTGHMSNERRFYKDARDWKVELYEKDSFTPRQICVREWRKTYSIDEIITKPLAYTNNMYKELRKVAYYWYSLNKSKKQRFHLEFVYCDNKIFIVQADSDTCNTNAKNPIDYDVSVPEKPEAEDLKTLKIYDYSETNYKKLNNLRVYKEIGLTTVTLYYLENREILEKLTSGIVDPDFEQDIQLLLNVQSIVIRSDTSCGDKKDKQMLPRSNELKSFDEVKAWLISKANEISKNKLILIIHNYIPAIASAFAHAKPNGTRVEIQALWGLPEGLYYNSHDTIIVKFPFTDIKKITIDNVFVTKKENFKDVFVYPEKTGKWTLGNVAEPYDWKCSIQDEKSIYDIAIESQKISNKYNQEVSVMWFVGVDENHYHSKNIAWFHEEIEIEQDSYTNDLYKRKYFKEEEYILRNRDDLENLSKNNNEIKCVRIKPIDESVFRDKGFLEQVGKIVKEKGLSILLEGAQLTHSYYQLKRTGANVVCTKSNEFDISNDMDFNKLVRDLIPEKIVSQGETVKCGVAVEELYSFLLKEKLLEEAYEVYDAADLEELKMEMADLLEVIDAINKKMLRSELSYINFNDRKHFENGNQIFSKYILNKAKQSYTFKYGNVYYLLNIFRHKTDYRIELRASNYFQSLKKDIASQDELLHIKNEIINCASLLLNSKSDRKSKTILEKIDQNIQKICKITLIKYDDVLKEKLEKYDKRGGFENGYVLLNTSLSESYTESDVFNPDECKYLTHVDKSHSKYTDLIRDDKENHTTLIMRFYIPIAVNDYDFQFETSKFKSLDCEFDGVNFNFKKNTNGKLKISIYSIINSTEQMSFFD